VAGIEGSAEAGDGFGGALAAGDFDGDGYDDLAVGVSGEDVGDVARAGAINVLYGSATGLIATGDQLWDQSTAGIEGSPELDDHFGSALAAGDFDENGFYDLAIGAPGEFIGDSPRGGVVHALYGSTGVGLTANLSELWHQDVFDVADETETNDEYGSSLAAGDFDGDGDDDLAIGVPNEGTGVRFQNGAVTLLDGTPAFGLEVQFNELDQFWHQDVTGVLGTAGDSDHFGHALAAGDFDGDGYDDLAIGVEGEDISGQLQAGAVNVLYGTSGDGLLAAGNEYWHQGVANVNGSPGFEDTFGYAVAAGDFDGDGFDDLAVGVNFEGVGSFQRAGAANVLYGASGGGLSATGDQLWHQGSGAAVASEDAAAAASAPPVANAGTPEGLALLPAAPNPFAGRTTLRFTLPEAGPARLTVYDALGRAVAVVVDETREAGPQEAAFDAGALPSGTYLVRLEAGGQVRVQRLTLVR
jgi:hypothetical protein